MRAALGYDRQYSNEMGVTMTNTSTPLTLAEFNAIGKPNPNYVNGVYVGDPGDAGFAETDEFATPTWNGIRFAKDEMNNVGRMCTVMYEECGRVWKVRNAMRDCVGHYYYMVVNTVTRESRVVPSNWMSNLY